MKKLNKCQQLKGIVASCIWFFCSSSFALPYPSISILFNSPPPSLILYGETLRIPVVMNFNNLGMYEQWTIPEGSSLEAVSGECPSIPYDSNTYRQGTCTMNIVIPGKALGKVVSGALKYHVWREDNYNWDLWFTSPEFSVSVVPHNLSMLPIPFQDATANQPFAYNLKSSVKFYDENQMAGVPAQGIVKPIEQDGLRFDQSDNKKYSWRRVRSVFLEIKSNKLNSLKIATR